MNSDDLLGALGRVAREEAEAEDPRWERLARGELTAAEEAELRKQAETDPEIAMRYEAYRPLDREARERIVARLSGAGGGGRVVPIRAWRRIAAVALPLAAAAAVVIWVERRGTEPPTLASNDVVPAYSLAATGGDRPARSGDTPAAGGPLDLHRESRLEIVLRPATAAPDGVAVRTFLVKDGAARPWSPAVQRSGDGALRVAGAAGALLGVPAGTWDLAFAVGREATLPSDPGAVAAAVANPGAPRAWQLLVQRVHLVDEP
jgi:hypothetical protein